MGRETVLQGVPGTWPLLQKVRSGESDIQTVFCYLSWLRRKNRGTAREAYFSQDDDQERIDLLLATLDLIDSTPDLLWQYCDLDRRFEVLLYLMNEATQCERQRGLFRASICGDSQIHPDACGTQGYPITWNDAETTFKIHEAIASLEFGCLAPHHATEKFNAQTLYKKGNDRRELTWLHTCFCELKEFYRSTASHGNASVIVVD